MQNRHDRVIFDPFLMEVIPNDQDALGLAVGPPDSIIGWGATENFSVFLHRAQNGDLVQNAEVRQSVMLAPG